MKAESRCSKCSSLFEYEAVLTPRGRPIKRHVCDSCREGRGKFLKKRWRKQVRDPIRKRSGNEPRAVATDGYEHTLEEISRRMGISPSTVEMVQRAALAKIRNSPELMEAFRQYAEAGMPRIKELLADRRDSVRADRLLELQMQVGDFWQIHDGLRDRARRLDMDPVPVKDLPLWEQRERRAVRAVRREMDEIMNEIVSLQRILRNEYEADADE